MAHLTQTFKQLLVVHFGISGDSHTVMKWTSRFTKERPCKNVCSAVVLCFNWCGVHCLGKACESGNLSAQICFLIFFKYTWAVLLVLSSRKEVIGVSCQ